MQELTHGQRVENASARIKEHLKQTEPQIMGNGDLLAGSLIGRLAVVLAMLENPNFERNPIYARDLIVEVICGYK